MGSPSITCFTFLLCSSCVLHLLSEAASTIEQGQFLRDGDKIVSSGNEFQLGFFSPENSYLRYVGTWYNKFSVQTVVWVANRNSPVLGKNGSLTIGNNGNLMVLDQNGVLLWSSNVSVGLTNSTATLTDTGNLILTSGSDPSKVSWQSFEHPTDSYLPGMALHMNASNGENHLLWSWKSVIDPSVGNYSTGIDTRGMPQIMTWQGTKRIWRSGHWNGIVFLGVPSMRSFHLNGFKFNKAEDGGWDVDYKAFSSDTMRFYIWWNGSIGQQTWDHGLNNWKLIQIHPGIECEQYNRCGVFGMCTGVATAVCGCLEGFHPKDHEHWHRGNQSGGCIRTTPLNCSDDRFFAMDRVKLPDFADVAALETSDECKQMCLKNCSCNAYAFVTGIQCMMWSVDLVDVQQFKDVGETLYIRLNRADIGRKRKIPVAIIGGVAAAAIVLAALIGLLWRYRARLQGSSDSEHRHKKLRPFNPYSSTQISKEFSGGIEGKEGGSGPDLPMFSFSVVAAATNDFANENKLGQGGFGPVYKGTLPGGQEIAVKRLSRLSGQGLEEFKNEIVLIAKLQHRNLVRLLGCSIEGEEKLLLYEYMPNKSLDFLLFDQTKEGQLDWRTRYTIIEGIARGLVYLHRDSRLRIIHRDLKASNILLDEEMIPKISDFGMARMFGGNENEANTVRVVGTYGYMSPEYAMEGIFSVKSDVYSFGVLLLEIVSARKNTSFRTSESLSLIRYSWNLWHDGKAMELVDPSIVDSCDRDEVLRCIHIGLLCVQDSTVSRPTMSSVILMMESENSTLPEPKRPTYSSLSGSMVPLDSDPEGDDTVSTNNVTMTQFVGR